MLIGLNRGSRFTVSSIRSQASRSEGSMGKSQAPRAPNSFNRSFWTVPEMRSSGTPCLRAVSSYRARRMGAVALMVMLVETLSSGIPAKSSSMSASDPMETPTLPTSPSASGSSASMPSWVGRSSASDSPVWPWPSKYLKRWFVSRGVPKPAYWRIVQSLPRYMLRWMPRVNGYSPGGGGASFTSSGPYTGWMAIPLRVTLTDGTPS